ncbi:uncharacterized protein SPAPADRAFT_132641 [Spathaspora passalidarum NRRL Y-27907]|uniref:Cullin family profile domain-containing protein n=1 Tax=Spathaspora passalidarum (strain NRRL Y-27907 / 11-Y1) TaxID=619300 RepID=G3AGE9_SPAPN|nr:uncharacterized protein SPAPADRAFT_132641 [Spathaspora passalidarum NRRL Y-27907]EGW35288.1 hypothetical protein SPAPADRAFT_132641 [Spathaspora passalidarum NRRL Y-27907]
MSHLDSSSTRESTPSHSTTPSHLRSSTSLDIDQSTHKRKKPNHTSSTVSESVILQLNEAKNSSYAVVDIVLSGGELAHSYSLYYRQIENLCRFKHIEQSQLTQVLYDKLSTYFNTQIKPEIDRILSGENDEQTMSEFLMLFNQYNEKLRILARLFLYLDKNYLLQHSTKKTIIEYGLFLFVEYVLNNETGSNQLSRILLHKHDKLLRTQRVSNTINPVTQQLTKLLIKLHSTRTPPTFEFNLTLISKIIDHYNELKETWRCQPNYIITVFHHMNQEIGYFKTCGKDKEFIQMLLMKLRWNLIFYDFNNVIRHELPELINKPELKLLYSYCKITEADYNYDSMSIFVYEVGCFLMDEFEKVIQNSRTDGKSVIPTLVESYSFYTESLTKLGESDSLEFELRNSLSRAVNTAGNNTYIISQLCKNIDSYFKKPENFPNFEYIMIIFKAISNKHEFLMFYKKDLSKRLLLNKSNVKDEEKLALEFLAEIGESDEDSISLKVMFNDLQLSASEYPQLASASDFEFVPLVLEKKHWPSPLYEELTITLPNNFQEILDTFTTKYCELGEKFKSRKLDWNNYKLHQIIIIGHFHEDIEIQCNLLQAVVIILFNEKHNYTLTELNQRTLMDERLLRQVLDTLVSKKLVIQTEGSFKLNSHFTSKSRKIKLAMLKDKPTDMTVTMSMERNRQEEYKATIVKVMKQHEKYSMTNLLQDCLDLLHKRNPTASVHDLKACIDVLITNEYLKRQDQDTLIYIA